MQRFTYHSSSSTDRTSYFANRSESYPRISSHSLPSRQSTVSRRNYSYDASAYLENLQERVDTLEVPLPTNAQDRLNPTVHDPAVKYDRRQNHADHMSVKAAHQFDMSLPHVVDLLGYMMDAYDTVTVYTTNLLEEGMLIYYPDPYVVPPNRSAAGVYKVGDNFDVKVKVKGRFAIVVRKFGTNIKVAPVYTFNDQGLSSKPRGMWKEYAHLTDEVYNDDPEEEGEILEGLRALRPPNKPIQIGEVFCRFKDTAAVHLLTTTVTLSSQILIAGTITPEALVSLRAMIAKMDG